MQMNNLKVKTKGFEKTLSQIKGEVPYAFNNYKRMEHHIGHTCSKLVDMHNKHGVGINFLRIYAEDTENKISIFESGTIDEISGTDESGILLRIKEEQSHYTVWLPSGSAIVSFDEDKRIVFKNELKHKWEFHPLVQLRILQSIPEGAVAVIPYVVMDDTEGTFFSELTSFCDAEQRLYRKSDWFSAGSPSDVWNYLINGSLYDPRVLKYNPSTGRGSNKQIICQQCAFAWWSYFGYLHRETGKRIYDVLQDEIAFSSLQDMKNDGGWRHGHWFDEMETHTRFQLDGIHMLISQYEKTKEPVWLKYAELGMSFVSENLTEQLDDGSLWFLHDTMEHKGRHHLKSTIFGKTPGNSLCINTHVQALTVLHRLRDISPENRACDEMYDRGKNALKRVLDLQPGEYLYRPLMSWIMVHKSRKRARFIMGKVYNALEWRIVKFIYWMIRLQYPRIVQGDGFTERDLTHASVSDPYHVINVKDFLTLYLQDPVECLRPYIENGVAFTRCLLRSLDLTHAVARSSFYIEFMDILYLYGKLIDDVSIEEMKVAEDKIFCQTGGYSLDYFASCLVRPQAQTIADSIPPVSEQNNGMNLSEREK